jgi:methylglutamate dehydrogenase subunit D
MLEIRSPLTDILNEGHFGATFANGPGVTLSSSPRLHLLQIAGWSDFEGTILPGLQKIGFDDAGDYRMSRQAKHMSLFRIAPDRILIASRFAIEFQRDITESDRLVYLELTQSKCSIIVEGKGAEKVMSRLAPIDFRLSDMPVGNYVQTSIHHVGILIYRTSEQSFEILTPVTWTRSIWELICVNADPFGYNVNLGS